MEKMNYKQTDDVVIDLKELVFFILRKWRVLILAGLIGVVLGCGVGFLKAQKSVEDLTVSDLHLAEIIQYGEYQALYDEQLRKETESVYMNMDADSAFKGRKSYGLTAGAQDLLLISEKYHSIFKNEQIYTDLVNASGLECSEVDVCELVQLSFLMQTHEGTEKQRDDRENESAVVSFEVIAPTREACAGMMKLLDERVQAINRSVESAYQGAKYDLLVDECLVGYQSAIETERRESTMLMASYIEKIDELKKTLTNDDMLYYREYYAEEKHVPDNTSAMLKWGIVLGVLFGGMMAAFYGVLFLMDGHVKNIDELKRVYGLHPIAHLNGNKKSSRCVIDRMLSSKQKYNSTAYLCAALDAMQAKRIHVCGDMENAQLAAQMKHLVDQEGITVSDCLAVDVNAQQLAREADGVVLYVQLWNTKHADLLRELEIAGNIDVRVLGVVVVD